MSSVQRREQMEPIKKKFKKTPKQISDLPEEVLIENSDISLQKGINAESLIFSLQLWSANDGTRPSLEGQP